MSATTNRACHGTTKLGGTCKAAPMTGSDYCIAHDEDSREKLGFGGAQPGSGRPRNLTEGMALREAIREKADDILSVVVNALEAQKPGWTDKDGMYHEGGPDWQARLRAAQELFDRGWGRPPQALEHSGPDGGPISIADMWHAGFGGGTSLN